MSSLQQGCLRRGRLPCWREALPQEMLQVHGLQVKVVSLLDEPLPPQAFSLCLDSFSAAQQRQKVKVSFCKQLFLLSKKLDSSTARTHGESLYCKVEIKNQKFNRNKSQKKEEGVKWVLNARLATSRSTQMRVQRSTRTRRPSSPRTERSFLSFCLTEKS